MKVVDIIVWVLLVIGGLNWGLVGAFDYDVVAHLLGAGSVAARVIYIAVGLSALYAIFKFRHCVMDHHDGGCCK